MSATFVQKESLGIFTLPLVLNSSLFGLTVSQTAHFWHSMCCWGSCRLLWSSLFNLGTIPYSFCTSNKGSQVLIGIALPVWFVLS